MNNNKNYNKEQIAQMNDEINNIITTYLIDLYGELGEDSKNHVYTLERIKLLMMCAYHNGYDMAKKEDSEELIELEKIIEKCKQAVNELKNIFKNEHRIA